MKNLAFLIISCLFTCYICSYFIVQPAFSQFQDEFELDIPLPEQPEEKQNPYRISIDADLINTYNDHIELGLSVDPYTSSLAGQENPQLQGLINRLSVHMQGELSVIDKLRIQLSLTPQYDNYNGKQGKLNEFDAFNGVALTELGYRPIKDLPEIVAWHQFQRLTRSLNVYNNNEQMIGLRFGRILEYHLRNQRFDDESQLKEDFLLVGSTNHRVMTRLQFGLLKQMVGKIEYGIEYSRYQTNLNNLILGIADIDDDQRRTDWRYIGSVKLLQTVGERFVFQEELNVFQNRSNVDYFNFTSVEAGVSAFFRFHEGRWGRLRLSRLLVGFAGRNIQDVSGINLEERDNRSDNQWGLNAQINWKFSPNVTLNADYQFTQNRTNEVDPILDFLNYNHNIVSITIRGSF